MSKRSRGRTCPICQLPERLHLPDGTCPGSIFEPIPTKGPPPHPAKPAEVPSPTPAGPPDLTQATQPPNDLVDEVIGERTRANPAFPAMVEQAAAARDLHQAIQAATEALEATPQMTATTGWRWWQAQSVARIAVQAAAPHLHADLQRRLEKAATLIAWLSAGQSCECEDVTLPDGTGPPCAPCDATAFLEELHALDLAAPATPEVDDA